MHEDWEEVTERALQALRHTGRAEVIDQTEAEVFDKATLEALYQLISHRHLDTVDYCLSTGKEANVFRGTTPEGVHVAVKIYRVFTSTFRSHHEYLWGDPRFQTRSLNKRELVETWALKEFKNLTRYVHAGAPVPTPLVVKRNVLLMEFIGDDGVGAPLLREVALEDPAAAYADLREFVVNGWEKAQLVHGDLSAFNVLVHEGRLVVIDTAQAVLKTHPRASELLHRDIHNVCHFFDRLGVATDPKALTEELLTKHDDEEE